VSTPPQEVIVGLDAGTTGVKAAAFGLDAPWTYVAVREYALTQASRDEAVQDPAAILRAIDGALGECVAAAAGRAIVGVSLGAAMHALLALDAERQPLTPVITWADARARDEARALRASGQGAELHTLTGAPVHPMTPLTKLMWFARHEPALLSGARWWVGLKDYIVWWLTGRLATELSSASGTGMLDMAARTWNPAALRLSGVSPRQLPEILSTTTVMELQPAAAGRIGLPAAIPVVIGAADGPLANLGIGAMSPGVAGLSLGTSGAVRAVVSEPVIDAAHALFCYALTDTTWVLGSAVSNGGEVARWAARSIAPDLAITSEDEAILELASSVPAGCDGVVMLPYLLAERGPLWNPDLTGAFLGVRADHTRAHLVRAALEGVGLQLRLITDQLDRVRPVTSVRATGGAFRAPLWREIVAGMLDRPLHIVSDVAGTARGAAALGLLALGRSATLEEGAALLTDHDGTDPEPVRVDDGAVRAYDRVRSSIPGLIGALAEVGQLVADDPDG
jgi:gluconokinase